MKDLCEIKLQLDDEGRLCVLYGTNAKRGEEEVSYLQKISTFLVVRVAEATCEMEESEEN